MKNKPLNLICLLSFLLPVHLFAQQDITGFWKGTLYNDTTQQTLTYEIAISQKDNGKFDGYSYTLFKGDNGADEVGVKTIIIKRNGNDIIIQDDKVVSQDFSVPTSKRIKKLMKLILSANDSSLVMSGSWQTNWTKEYHPVTGRIKIQHKKDYTNEPLMKKLDEMKLSDNLSFVPQVKKQEVAVMPKTQASSQPSTEIARSTETKKLRSIVHSNDSSQTIATVVKPAKKIKRPASINTSKDTAAANAMAVSNSTKKPKAAIKKEITKPVEVPAAAEANIRKTQTIQSVTFQSDSLSLTIYDNGEIDGDTVSILMNGTLIFSKEGLSDKPKTKVISTKNTDSLLLVLYAENLGSIPPNTGLLIIYDGKKRYEVYFSADLQTNAAILLTRKKEGT